jgi:hypothetical protein
MSIVLELQEGIYNNSLSTVEVLRKAYIISRKLNIKDISEWLDSEMNGYNDCKVPNYRKVSGIIRGWNPYHGWQPVMMEKEMEETCSSFSLSQSIDEIECLINDVEGNTIECRNGVTSHLIKELKADIKINLSKSQLKNILGIVSNKVLDWTLDLEEKGVLGENMTFTKEEKDKAVNISISGVHNSPIQIQTENSSQEVNYSLGQKDLLKANDLISSLEAVLEDNCKLTNDLMADFESVKLQLKKEKPNKGFIKGLLVPIGGVISSIPKAVEILESLMSIFN